MRKNGEQSEVRVGVGHERQDIAGRSSTNFGRSSWASRLHGASYMSKLASSLSIIAAVTLGFVTPAYAQTRADSHASGTILNPTWETSAGYQLLHVPDQTFPFGLNVD